MRTRPNNNGSSSPTDAPRIDFVDLERRVERIVNALNTPPLYVPEVSHPERIEYSRSNAYDPSKIPVLKKLNVIRKKVREYGNFFVEGDGEIGTHPDASNSNNGRESPTPGKKS